MFATARFTVALADAAHFEAQLNTALDAFSHCAGFKSGEFGQNLDELTLWSLVTHWENVGSMRFLFWPRQLLSQVPMTSRTQSKILIRK